MKIAIGGDYAGFPLKATVIKAVEALGHEVTDHGCYDLTPVDFPDITRRVCGEVLAKRADRATLVCGTGVGASIAANKIPGIRASVCHDIQTAHQCVEHDDVNVICVGAKIVSEWLVVTLWSGICSPNLVQMKTATAGWKSCMRWKKLLLQEG